MIRHRARARSATRTGRWIALGVVGLALLGGMFALGLLVGKHASRQSPPVAAEPTRKPVTTPRRGGLSEAHAERAVAQQERLTFYHTLTAPLTPVSAPPKRDLPPKPEPATVKPRPKPDTSPSVDPPTGDRVPAASERHDSSEKADEWTVQVGVFKNAQQAERIKRELADSGFPAHLTSSAGEDGQPRYRVRVGAYRTRAEAVKTAERLRSQREVSTYVTTR